MPPEVVETFSSPRSAPHPRVIPLFQTNYIPQSRPKLSIHFDLPQRTRPRPYPAPTTDYHRPTSKTPEEPEVSSSTSSGDGDHINSEPPASPLTPTPDEQDTPSGPTRHSELVLIPQPTNFTIAGSGWKPVVITKMRQRAKEIIKASLNPEIPWGEQNSEARVSAAEQLSKAFADLQNHESNWGARAVFREQLKSMKDTTRKAKNRRNEQQESD